MKRHELASLPAQPHDTSKRTITAQHSTKSTHLQHTIRNNHHHNNNNPLSPRQLFQSRVRTLADNQDDASPIRTPERQHDFLSNLRLAVASPTPDRKTAFQPSYFHVSPQREPEFLLEERQAWRGVSSEKEEDGDEKDGDIPVLRQSLDDERLSSTVHDATLKPFGPLRTGGVGGGGPVARPKTSRGELLAREEKDAAEVVRRSKFLEGSMGRKSSGVSSTWVEHGERLSLDLLSEKEGEDDDDATPKAERQARESFDSEDLAEFKVGSTTPGTLKQRFAKFASTIKGRAEGQKNRGDGQKEVDGEQKEPKRKGLRKSISTWSLHGFSDKVKFFSTDTPTTPAKDPEQERIQALNDRKRKAEETYAQQFGTKKQKANDGNAVEDKDRTIRGNTRTLKKRSVSAHSTITPKTSRRRETPRSAAPAIVDPADIVEDGGTDHHKRPSRRELEKENQTLRAMLREQQAQNRAHLQHSASRSSFHLAMDMSEDEGKPVVITNSRINASRSGQKKGIPPVPPLPNRAALATMGNRGVETHDATVKQRSTFADTGTVKRVGPVLAMCPEGQDENKPVESERNGGRQAWEWPDDVF